MSDEKPSLHIDNDWKKQAQEEKRRLTEEEQKRNAEKRASRLRTGRRNRWRHAIGGQRAAGPESSRGRGPGGQPRERAVPEASFPTLVNSLMTQVLLYLGELTPRGVEPQINLDMAKFNVDLLGVLEEKTKNNLSADEQKLLDTALYEVRMRYVSVASAYATV